MSDSALETVYRLALKHRQTLHDMTDYLRDDETVSGLADDHDTEVADYLQTASSIVRVMNIAHLPGDISPNGLNALHEALKEISRVLEQDWANEIMNCPRALFTNKVRANR